jgi:hypothetical protein
MMRTMVQAVVVVAALGLALAGPGRVQAQEYVYYSPSWSYSRPPIYRSAPNVVRTVPTYRAPRGIYRSTGYPYSYPSTSPLRYMRAWRDDSRYSTWSSGRTTTYRRSPERQHVGLRRDYELPYNPEAPGGPNH